MQNNETEQKQTAALAAQTPKNKDYEYALILGITIGIFLIPTEMNLSKHHNFSVYIYWFTVFIFPILSVIGLFIARLLFAKISVLWQFVKFALIGISNTAINFGVLNLLSFASGVTRGVWTAIFAAIAFFAAMANSYIWNSHWSFKNNNKRTPAEFLQFFTVTFVGSLINIAVVYLVVNKIQYPSSISPQLWLNIANVIATLTVMFWDFSGFKFIVFRPKTQQQA